MKIEKIDNNLFKVKFDNSKTTLYMDNDNVCRYRSNMTYSFLGYDPGSNKTKSSEKPSNTDVGHKYKKIMRDRNTGETIEGDVYDVLEAFKIDCSAMGHAIKKLLMAGARGHKDFDKDCDEAINSIKQSKILNRYRE